MNLWPKMLSRLRNLLPVRTFQFDCPLVLFQSDDWGRAGLQDHNGLEKFRSAGISLGERPYDFYTLETANDVHSLSQLLKGHRDSVGRPPTFEMNFIVANLDCGQAAEQGQLSFLPLSEGLPRGWSRPGLIDAYRTGISDGVFTPALHGTSHFCRRAVARAAADDERRALLRTFWAAGTPYIYWRMPWIGYEYWDPETSDEQFLPEPTQKEFIGQTVGAFAKLFSSLPRSACAPGYRADSNTHRGWSMHGIRIAQNGPGTFAPPYMGEHDLLNLSRTVEFEPATDAAFSLENCLAQAQSCFAAGIPAIVSAHSINFHSTVKDFRSKTLGFMDQFLNALESKYSDLLYLRDGDLYDAIHKGTFEGPDGMVRLNVKQKKILRSSLVARNS